ncbi:MAG: creatininase family protein [Gemmataceae bacterium]|nr:creatininase family protein [Gemmataceae bacterium]
MRFAEMTAPEIRRIDRQRVVVVAPIAACEQHSDHLPVLTDTILVTAVAEAAESRSPEMLLLLPTLWLGASHHHLRFGGTLSLAVELHVAVLRELVKPVLDEGFSRLLLLNGHGGNIDTMQTALRSLQPDYRQCILSAASYWDLAQSELAALAEGPRKIMGHACEFETSMMLALRPDLVRRDRIRNDVESEAPELRGLFLAHDMRQRTDHGAVGYCELASADKGAKMIAAAAERVVEVVHTLLRQPLPS